MKIDSDKLSREKIATEIDKNFFVEASAGSGKTTSLVYRMVSLVEHDVPVDKICTITFTKAAADEFFERFQKLLSIRSGDQPDRSDEYLGQRTEKTKKKCQEALNNIDLCFLGTLDAFCNMIAHELPAELKIPSNSEIISDEENEKIISEEYNNILKDIYHPLHYLSLQFNNSFSNPYECFVTGISMFRDIRHIDIQYDKDILNSDFETYFSNEKKALLKILSVLSDPSISNDDLYKTDKNAGKEKVQARNNVMTKYRLLKNKSWNNEICNLTYLLKDISKMDGFLEDAMNTSLDVYLDAPQRKGAMAKYNADFINELKTISDKLEEYKYSLFFHFILSVLHEITEKLRVIGKFQFFDILLYLTKAFRESALSDRVLVDHIRERHQYFLIDESQDTSPLQTEMFLYLTGTKKDEDWKKLEPIEGSLFIVGDPKQSIYGFRGADVKAYLENKKIFEKKDEVLVLTRNYRSNASLREWFNQTFDDMLNYQNGPLKRYTLRHLDIPIDEDDVSKNVPNNPEIIDGVYKVVVHTKDKEDADETARLILDIKKNRKLYVRERGPQGFYMRERDITFGDFLVIPRGTNIDEYIDAFKRHNIPLIVEAKTPFDQATSLIVIKDLLYLLKNPYNISHLLSVLQGPMYQLDDLDIIKMKNDGFSLDLSCLEGVNFTDEKHQQIISKLNDLFNKTAGMSFSSTLLYLLNDSELDILHHVSSNDLEYTYFIIEKIKQKEEDGTISCLRQLEEYISDFSSIKGEEQRTLRFSEKVDRVKIANLHKVKGLEAPIVILAKPKEGKKESIRFVDYVSNPPIAKISKVKVDDPSKNISIVLTNKYVNELPDWEASDESERDRLAYVGATRARNVLIVTTANDLRKDKKNPWEKLLGYIDDSRYLDIPSEVEIKEKEIAEESEHASVVDPSLYEQSLKYRSPSEKRIAIIHNDDEMSDLIDMDLASGEAALKGTVIHKLMECLAYYKDYSRVNDLVKSIVDDYAVSKYEELLKEVAHTMINGGYPQVNSVIDDDILKILRESKEVYTEVPFSYLSSNKTSVITGTIDLLYKDKDDKYHIIDYKTGEEDDVSILEKEYEQQLKDYYFALKKIGIEADYHIYHIDIYEKEDEEKIS